MIVGKRLGKSLLELGGNNAMIITENANLNIAIRAAVFGAVGQQVRGVQLQGD